MKTWQIQQAKNRLSEVIDNALRGAHQTITRRGEPVAVVLSVDQYRRLRTPRKSLVDFLAQSPLKGVHLKITREKDLPRETVL